MTSKCELCFGLLILQFFIINGEIVSTENGQINGTIAQSWTGQNFHAFYGIPYAKPPIGELRFKPPQPVESWSGVRPTTEYGPICWNPIWQENLPEMGEDCLTLNVFTKNLPSDTTTELKPVIVFIHGGGFRTGSASLEAGPRYLMDRDIVYVNINYRLGALGFLATGTKEAPGNVGMKDQVAALKWVKTNIQNFGGNPDKITISGMSAGGHSVTSHMVSPMSQNLFHGLITHSGSVTFAMGLTDNYIENAIYIANKVGCTSENPEVFVECLRTKSAEDIVNVVLTDAPYCSSIGWRPVIERDFGQERFLTEDPNETYRNKNFPKIPVIAGITSNEFATSAYGGGKRATCMTITTAIVIWILAIICGIPALAGSNIKHIVVNSRVSFEVCYPFPQEWGPEYAKGMVLFRFLIYYAVPLVLIGIFYIMIAIHLVFTSRVPGEIQGAMRQVIARKKVAVTVLAFVVIFGICFFPHHLFMLWFYYNPNSNEDYNTFWHILRIIGFCLSFANSCANPILLYCVSGAFRKHFNRYLLCKGSSSSRRRNADNLAYRDTSLTSTISRKYPSKRLGNRSCRIQETTITIQIGGTGMNGIADKEHLNRI